MPSRALIFYSRIPSYNIKAKTRLGKDINNPQLASEFARILIIDLFHHYLPEHDEYDVIFAYQGDAQLWDESDTMQATFIEAVAENLGDSMKEMIYTQLKTHDEVILVGSDLVMLTKEKILRYFDALSNHTIVLAPTEDKGYGLIGMNKPVDVFSGITNWESRSDGFNLVTETAELANELNEDLYIGEELFDIDYAKDIKTMMKTIAPQGNLLPEYHHLLATYTFVLEQAKDFRL